MFQTKEAKNMGFPVNPETITFGLDVEEKRVIVAQGKDGATNFRYLGSVDGWLLSHLPYLSKGQNVEAVLIGVKKGLRGSLKQYAKLAELAKVLYEENKPEFEGKVVNGPSVYPTLNGAIKFRPTSYGLWARL